jgi:hypothetical protein
MKYKTFARLRVGVPLAMAGSVVGGVVATRPNTAAPTTTRVVQVATSRAIQPVASVPASAPVSVAALPGELTTVDREVLRLRDRPVSEGTIDGSSTKFREKFENAVIELRSDTGKGSTTWNRAKVDLDGDKLFDQKWDFAPGSVSQKVAPNDDENYSETYRLTNKRWVLASVGTPTTVSATASATVVAGGGTGTVLRSIDQEVLRLQKQALSNGTSDGSSLKWRVKQGATVIELRSDTNKGSTSWNRVKLDLDGDKQIDENWTFTATGEVERQVSVADDGTYGEMYRLDGTQWVRT